MRSMLITLLACFCFTAVRAEERRPNILWINAEDMSPHLGCYQHPDAVTPNIDALAAEGIIYKNAFATAPICCPSRSCLATGLYATSLGTQHLRCEVTIPDRVVPLATRLRKLGYFCTNTGKSDYNFDASGIWDAWNNDPAPWRARKPRQPFFAFITVGETHEGRINRRQQFDEATADLPESLKHDPDRVHIPPFYPDTPETRRIFAGMHDLATVFDRKVGGILNRLKKDDDLQNTIIFVFGDHGNGLPRYKRWLYDSGLRVPLVVYVPPKFRELAPTRTGSMTDRLVSFVDFPATAMSLAGADVPAILQGKPFLGKTIAEPRKFVFGARSRADDMFEVSRSVSDGRYIYIRHFMPYLPYIQNSVIYDDTKDAFRELRRLHEAAQLNEYAERLWAPRKPVEELYDLQNDPHELNNLADQQSHASIKQNLAKELRRWILKHRDSGFLPEAEYQIRAAQAKLTPFDIVQDSARFDLENTLRAAWRVGTNDDEDLQVSGLNHEEAGVRYWSAIGLLARDDLRPFSMEALPNKLDDPSPSVRIAAAEAILKHTTDPGLLESALSNLGNVMEDDRPYVALQAARAAADQGERAKRLVPVMKKIIDKNRSQPGSRRPYKDFNYASFTGWALETALVNCGETEFVAKLRTPAIPKTPVIVSDWWRICEMPDLGELNGPDSRRQHIVDHGFIQADSGKWQLWACIRGTAVSRVLYRWEGDTLESGPWKPVGIAARAQKKYGEQIRMRDGSSVETMGAPFFLKEKGRYFCFYHSGGIRLMTSEDGRRYERALDEAGSNLLYPDGGRDVMVLKIGDTYHGYSTISAPQDDGEVISYVKLKTSPDMRHWGGAKIVCRGGKDSKSGVAFESPFVVALDGYYYLFRASSMTFKTYVYRSRDPSMFADHNDENLIAELPIKAPELIEHKGQWYISDLSDFQGIKLARLDWHLQPNE